MKQVVWLPCNQCDLQVHTPVFQFLTEGVTCPECGQRLAGPDAAPAAPAAVRESEEKFRQELAREETPCCD